MLVGRDDALPPAPVRGDADFVPDSQLAQAVMALSVSGNFMFDAATHRDFLGALLGTGIDRSKVNMIRWLHFRVLVGMNALKIVLGWWCCWQHRVGERVGDCWLHEPSQ